MLLCSIVFLWHPTEIYFSKHHHDCDYSTMTSAGKYLSRVGKPMVYHATQSVIYRAASVQLFFFFPYVRVRIVKQQDLPQTMPNRCG